MFLTTATDTIQPPAALRLDRDTHTHSQSVSVQTVDNYDSKRINNLTHHLCISPWQWLQGQTASLQNKLHPRPMSQHLHGLPESSVCKCVSIFNPALHLLHLRVVCVCVHGYKKDSCFVFCFTNAFSLGVSYTLLDSCPPPPPPPPPFTPWHNSISVRGSPWSCQCSQSYCRLVRRTVWRRQPLQLEAALPPELWLAPHTSSALGRTLCTSASS